jgi:Na+/proline symporter
MKNAAHIWRTYRGLWIPLVIGLVALWYVIESDDTIGEILIGYAFDMLLIIGCVVLSAQLFWYTDKIGQRRKWRRGWIVGVPLGLTVLLYFLVSFVIG